MLVVKNLLPSAGDVREMDLIPGSGRYPGEEENDNLLQYSCLDNPMDSEAWWTAVQRVAKSRTRQKRLCRQSGKLSCAEKSRLHRNYSSKVTKQTSWLSSITTSSNKLCVKGRKCDFQSWKLLFKMSSFVQKISETWNKNMVYTLGKKARNKNCPQGG